MKAGRKMMTLTFECNQVEVEEEMLHGTVKSREVVGRTRPLWDLASIPKSRGGTRRNDPANFLSWITAAIP